MDNLLRIVGPGMKMVGLVQWGKTWAMGINAIMTKHFGMNCE
jgi:hypothetical protein